MLQVFLPYTKSTISQRFGANANVSYARDGLKGHTSYDWSVPYGTPIPNCTADAYCYSLMAKDNPDPNKYRAMFFLVEPGDGTCYEVSYGHCATMTAEVGKTYQVGDTIGTVGNFGIVFSDHEVTREEKLAGSHAGAHLHGPQIRPLAKVKKRTGRQVIQDAKGPLKKDGYYFEVLDYNNGYNGCVSLAPFSTETIATKASEPKQYEELAIENYTKAIENIRYVPQPMQPYFLQVWNEILESLRKLLR